MEIMIPAKHILAAYDIPKASKKDLQFRRILQGVHVASDGKGYKVESTDSHILARIEHDYAEGNDAASFTIPPETIEEFKLADMLTFEPLEDMKCKVTRITNFGKKATSSVTEWEFNAIEGKYPITKQLIAESPHGCYRYAPQVDASLMGRLMGVAEKCLGKKQRVEISWAEHKQVAPLMLFSRGEIDLTMVLMPLQHAEKESMLKKSKPYGKDEQAVDELTKELEAAKANMEMWKAKASEAEKALEEKGEHVDDSRVKELEAELAKTRAELDEVWRENATLKATKKEGLAEFKAMDEKLKSAREDTAAEVTLDTMRKWCEGKNLVATQKRPGCCIWVEGESEPYESELKKLGFRWAGKSRKAWYLKN